MRAITLGDGSRLRLTAKEARALLWFPAFPDLTSVDRVAPAYVRESLRVLLQNELIYRDGHGPTFGLTPSGDRAQEDLER